MCCQLFGSLTTWKHFSRILFPVALFLASVPSEQFSEQKELWWNASSAPFDDYNSPHLCVRIRGYPNRWIDDDDNSMMVGMSFLPSTHIFGPCALSSALATTFHLTSLRDFRRTNFFVPSKNNNNKKLLPTIRWDSIVSQAFFLFLLRFASGMNAREDLINCNMSFHDTFLLPKLLALAFSPKWIWWVLWWCSAGDGRKMWSNEASAGLRVDDNGDNGHVLWT